MSVAGELQALQSAGCGRGTRRRGSISARGRSGGLRPELKSDPVGRGDLGTALRYALDAVPGEQDPDGVVSLALGDLHTVIGRLHDGVVFEYLGLAFNEIDLSTHATLPECTRR